MKSIIFSFDGVLIDSSKCILDSFNSTTEAMGVPREVSEVKHLLGLPFEMVLENVLSEVHSDVSGDDIARGRSLYEAFFAENMKEMIKPTADVMAVLKHLKQEGMKLGLVSFRTRENLESVMRLMELDDCFDVIQCKDDFSKNVFGIESVWKLISMLKAEVNDVLYVSSTGHALSLVKGLGCQTAIIKSEYYPQHYSKEYQVDYTLNSLDELLSITSRQDKLIPEILHGLSSLKAQ